MFWQLSTFTGCAPAVCSEAHLHTFPVDGGYVAIACKCIISDVMPNCTSHPAHSCPFTYLGQSIPALCRRFPSTAALSVSKNPTVSLAGSDRTVSVQARRLDTCSQDYGTRPVTCVTTDRCKLVLHICRRYFKPNDEPQLAP